MRILGADVADDIGGQEGLFFQLLGSVEHNGEGVAHIRSVHSVVCQLDAVALGGGQDDLGLEVLMHVLGAMIAEGEGPARGIQVDAGIGGRQQHFIGAVGVGLNLAVVDGAVVGLQGGNVGIELIRPGQELAHVLAVLGDDELIAAIVQIGGVGFHIVLAIRASHGFHNNVILGVAQQLRVSRPAKHDAGAWIAVLLNLGAHHIGSLGEALGIQRAAYIQLMRPLDGLFVVFGGGHKVGFAILVQAHVVAGAAGLHAEGQQQVVQIARQRSGIDEAIATLARLGEGGQHFGQLGVGRGHLQVQLIQPNLVDVHFIGGSGAAGQLLGQGIDLALGVSAQRLHGRIALKDSSQVGHILSDVIGQLNKVILVEGDIRIVQGDGAEERIGQCFQAGGQHQALLIRPGGIVIGLPFDVHAGSLANFLEEGSLGKVNAPAVRPAHDGDGEGVVLGCGSAAHAQQHAQRQEQ